MPWLVDVTDNKEEGFAEGDVLFPTEADDRTRNALDRATQCALAACRGLAELSPESATCLRPAADALLLEIAHHIAGTMIPATPSRTEH